jgi:phage shock protein A
MFGMEAETQTWIGVAVLGITTFGGVMTGLFALLKSLIEKKYDAIFVKLKAELELCQEHHADSERDRAELWRKVTEAEARADAAEKRADEAEARARQAMHRLDAVESKIANAMIEANL